MLGTWSRFCSIRHRLLSSSNMNRTSLLRSPSILNINPLCKVYRRRKVMDHRSAVNTWFCLDADASMVFYESAPKVMAFNVRQNSTFEFCLYFWHSMLKFTQRFPTLLNVENQQLLFWNNSLYPPCIRLARGKFKLTNQDSAGGKNSSVLGARLFKTPIKLTCD